MKNITLRKKPRTNTPVIIAIPAKHRKWLKEVPHLSLRALRKTPVNHEDMFNVLMRLHVGLNIARLEYESETVDDMLNVLTWGGKALQQIMDNGTGITDEQLSWLEAGLEATDEMTDVVTRRTYVEVLENTTKQVGELAKANGYTLCLVTTKKPHTQKFFTKA